jgi:hypothetical protein
VHMLSRCNGRRPVLLQKKLQTMHIRLISRGWQESIDLISLYSCESVTYFIPFHPIWPYLDPPYLIPTYFTSTYLTPTCLTLTHLIPTYLILPQSRYKFWKLLFGFYTACSNNTVTAPIHYAWTKIILHYL